MTFRVVSKGKSPGELFSLLSFPSPSSSPSSLSHSSFFHSLSQLTTSTITDTTYTTFYHSIPPQQSSSRVLVGSDTTGPAEFRTSPPREIDLLSYTQLIPHTYIHTHTTITMRATFALCSAARTPLIRFVGKRSVPSTFLHPEARGLEESRPGPTRPEPHPLYLPSSNTS